MPAPEGILLDMPAIEIVPPEQHPLPNPDSII
jgi:hypothetical protein